MLERRQLSATTNSGPHYADISPHLHCCYQPQNDHFHHRNFHITADGKTSNFPRIHFNSPITEHPHFTNMKSPGRSCGTCRGISSELNALHIRSPLIQIAASHVIEVSQPVCIVSGQIVNVKDTECASPGRDQMTASAPPLGQHHV